MKLKLRLVQYLLMSLVGLATLASEVSVAQTNGTHEMIHTANMIPIEAMHNTKPLPISALPSSPGQGAFGAIQEIITILESDPATNWSKVNINALREHLVDMDRLTTSASVAETKLEDGLKMVITGDKRTLQAIKAMVPAHAPMINGVNGWVVVATVNDQSTTLSVTSSQAQQIDRIRGLGFYGLMASGSHHQMHHLSLAKGNDVHAQ